MVENSNEGTDHILSTVDIYRLQDNVENLTIYGAAALGVGNEVDNVISVYQPPPTGPYDPYFGVILEGGLGNDTITGYYTFGPGGGLRNADD